MEQQDQQVMAKTFKDLKAKLHSDYLQDVKNQIHEVQRQLTNEIPEIKKALANLRAESDPDETVRSILAVDQKIRGMVKSFISGSLEEHQNEKTTLAEEIQEACTNFQFMQPDTDFIKWMQGPEAEPRQNYHPHEMLFGGQQYQRKYAFILDVLPRKIGEPGSFSNNQVRNALGGLKNGGADREQAILKLVQRCISKDLNAALDWFINAVGQDFQKYWRLAREDAQKQPDGYVQRLAFHNTAWHFLEEHFNESLKKFLNDSRKKLSLNLEPKTSHLRPAFLKKVWEGRQKVWEFEKTSSSSWQWLEYFRPYFCFHGFSMAKSQTVQKMQYEVQPSPDEYTDTTAKQHSGSEAQKAATLEALNQHRCTALFDSFSMAKGRMCITEKDIDEVKLMAGRYILALIVEIIHDLEWQLHHMFQEFLESLDQSSLLSEPDPSKYKKLRELALDSDQNKIYGVIETKEKELQEKERCLAEVQHIRACFEKGDQTFRSYKAGA